MDTLSEQVTRTLRDWILHGQFKAGERVEEVPISLRMGVSRTPVRAALSTLCNEGLIDHRPNRGYQVREFAPDAVLAAYEVRSVLEGLACREAARRGLSAAQADTLRQCLQEGDRLLAGATLQPEHHAPYQRVNVLLHNTLVEAAGNTSLQRFTELAQNIPYASGRIVLWHDHGVILRSHGDHHRIVEAVLARDAVRAEQLMREHVYYAGVILQANFTSTDGAAPARAEIPTRSKPQALDARP